MSVRFLVFVEKCHKNKKESFAYVKQVGSNFGLASEVMLSLHFQLNIDIN